MAKKPMSGTRKCCEGANHSGKGEVMQWMVDNRTRPSRKKAHWMRPWHEKSSYLYSECSFAFDEGYYFLFDNEAPKCKRCIKIQEAQNATRDS